jgi:hypothetical protein
MDSHKTNKIFVFGHCKDFEAGFKSERRCSVSRYNITRKFAFENPQEAAG